MARDFAAELLATGVRCVGEISESGRFAFQHRPELVLLSEWMEKKAIRSYLELGIYQGGLLTTLHEVFRFKLVAGCDEGSLQKRRGLPVELPPDARICWAKTESPEYRKFRQALGKVDLVFIDADHAYGSVRQDYEREKRQPHRFLAFHDIKNTVRAPDVVRFWNDLGGKKTELFVPRMVAPSGAWPREDYEMGIGIWSEKETP